MVPPPIEAVRVGRTQHSDAHQLKQAQEAIRFFSQAVDNIVRKSEGNLSEEAAEIKSELDFAMRLSGFSAAVAPHIQAENSAVLRKVGSARSCNCHAVVSSPPERSGDFRATLVIGSSIDCSDTRGTWRTAQVTDVKEDLLHVHYARSPAKWDEWLTRDNSRIGGSKQRGRNVSRKRQRSSTGHVQR